MLHRYSCRGSYAPAVHLSQLLCCPGLPPSPPPRLPPPLLQALEYQLQQGIADTAKVDACLVPAGARHDYAPEAHCAVGVIRRLQEL